MNTTLRNRSKRFVTLQMDERGLSTVEYVIVLVLIAVTGIAVWKGFGQTVRAKIESANTAMSSEVSATQ